MLYGCIVSSDLQESKFGKNMMKSWFPTFNFDKYSDPSLNLFRRRLLTLQPGIQLLNMLQIGSGEFVSGILFKCLGSTYNNSINTIWTAAVWEKAELVIKDISGSGWIRIFFPSIPQKWRLVGNCSRSNRSQPFSNVMSISGIGFSSLEIIMSVNNENDRGVLVTEQI